MMVQDTPVLVPPPATAVPNEAQCTRVDLMCNDGYRTSMIHWAAPQGGRRSPILYVHGIQSHPGWFTGSAQALWRAGFDVYQLTRRGNGDNALQRGDASGPKQLLDDLDLAQRVAIARSGVATCHMLGVSWGGKYIAALLAGRTDALARTASMTLLSPGLCARVQPAFLTRLKVLFSVFVCGGKRFDIPLNDEALFTRNPTMQRYLREDPCRLHQGTARLFVTSARMDRQLHRARTGCIHVPSRLILAEHDRIIDNPRTKALFEHLTGEHGRVVTLPGEHTLDFEADPHGFHETLVSGLVEADTR
jgi:acylglycerol lipase